MEVRDKLATLKKLQELDRLLSHYRRMRDYEPARLDEQRAKIAEEEARLKGLGDKHTAVQRDMSRRELDVKTRQARIDHLKTQMLTARTNKECQAFLKEVSLEEVEKSRAEDELLNMMISTESFAKEEVAIKAVIEKAKKDFEGLSREVKAALDEAAAKEVELLQSRQAVIGSLDADILRRYESLFKSRNGEAVVASTFEAGSGGEEGQFMCRGCFVPITHQMLNLLMIGKEIITCKSCGRILYMEDHKES